MKQRGQFVTDKILDTAAHLFYTQGYNATGINQVIEEANIAKASLYKHFDSKNDLMLAYLKRFHQTWFTALEKYISEVPDRKEKLLAIFDYHSHRQKIREFGGCPFVKANNELGLEDAKILAEIQNAKLRLKSLIKSLVADSNHKKILTDAELVETVFQMLEGSIVAASIFKTESELEAAKKIVQKFI